MIAPTPSNVKAALDFISPDSPREDWVKVAMAVKSGLNGSGFDVFNEWSKNGHNYNEADTKDTWNSIKSGGKVGIGTLFYMAQVNGWTFDNAEEESPIERAKRERAHAESVKRDTEKKASKAAIAANKAVSLWNAGAAVGEHPYLTKKGVKSDALRVLSIEKVTEILGYTPKSDGTPLTGQILIARVEINGTVSTSEMIDESGKKSAIAGGTKSGGYWAAQLLPAKDSAFDLLIGEGIATVLSAKEATGYYAIAALTAGNLEKVAVTMRKRYPSANITILADIGNGQDKAEKAAKTAQAFLAVPQFANSNDTGTDFNDLFQVEGIEIVREKIKAASIVHEEKNIFSENEKNPTHPTLSSNDAGLILHQSYTKPTPEAVNPTPKPTLIEPGIFVCQTTEGKLSRVIESKAAKILAELLKNERFAWNTDAASWHKFDGSCWTPLKSAAEPERVILSAMFDGCEPVGFKQAYFNGVTNIMLRAGLIPLPSIQEGKIPFKNGLLDIATRALEPITPENAQTWCIPHNYHRGNSCPAFTDWLNSVTGNDAGLIQLLRAYINACLIGRADLQKFLHLLGSGGTGKSTFIRLLFAMLGHQNCVTTDLQNLEQNRFETAGIYGKRLTAVTDSDKYGGAVNVLKALTGQDPVRNEQKHAQQKGTYIYTGMVLIASNEPLASTDYTSGLERRRLVVKFDKRIPLADKAAFIAAGGEEKLHQEIPAIINWALELTHDEVTKIFMHPPKAAMEAGFESLTAQNPIAEWITENLLPAADNWVLVGVREEVRDVNGAMFFNGANDRLYPNYLQWCKQHGRESLALRRFRHAAVDMLKTMGADVEEARRSQGQGIAGVKIRAEFEALHHWGSLGLNKKM